MRTVQGLRLAVPLDGWPRYIPKARRLRGTKAKGITFERKVGKVLRGLWPHVHSGRWFEYEDAKGVGCCQPDHFVILEDRVLCVECKLSECPAGWDQLALLYRPVLSAAFGLPVQGVQAVRFLRSGQRPIPDIREALALAPGKDCLWHLLV